ncbi:MAG: family 78 glycoside hydrolase catalytic domain [Clostridia bacterium]|nr:family 78 glycoside hydrolase catalytic domain [Clostridia bacterium]
MRQKVPFDYSSWIWCNKYPRPDEYGEFYAGFEYTGEHAVTAYISADSNYALYVNGRFAASGQYADYPYDKVYDELDLTDYCKRGKNHIAIIVWYYGLKDCSCYYYGNAALRFALWDGEKCVCVSNKDTKSRLSNTYAQHLERKITGQMGWGWNYNAAAEDRWVFGEGEGFHDSFMIPLAPPLRRRPCKKLVHERIASGRMIKRMEDGTLLYDLGREEVGYLSLELEAHTEQKLTISWGEHIRDGRVRAILGNRNFYTEYFTKKGLNAYVNPFRRIACRYLEIKAEDPTAIRIRTLGVIPTVYPLNTLQPPRLTETQQRIYDACVRTLRLCMHEHYEDCPWREQALYAMDSRNQMLCGYHAFGEYEFARASLELIAKDNRPDGFLSICYPSSFDLVIPSFSLHFITEAYEHYKYSANKRFLRSIFPKMKSVLGTFTSKMKNGLVPQFPELWNFYEWSDGLSNKIKERDPEDPHVVLNCLLLRSLEHMTELAEELGDVDARESYKALVPSLRINIRKTFYDPTRGVFTNYPKGEKYSQLGNALAILAGVVTGEAAEKLAHKLVWDGKMTQTSLSMRCFFYDALLAVSSKYRAHILVDIERIYLPMLEGGTGTVWETEKGADDFGRAGSLCHGWSAMPVYYYHKFFK